MRLQLPDAVRGLSWSAQAASRIALLWPLKAVGTCLFMILFFRAYFAVLEDPLGVPRIMPVTVFDDWLPFSPLAFPVYVSLWFYVSLVPALMGSLRALLWFGVWITAMCACCLGIFWLFPTAVPEAGIDWSLHPQMALIKGIDPGGNACPSLHVASAVFTAFWLERVLRDIDAPRACHGANRALCLLILWSTVATRQHVVLDVVAGVVVGLLFALPALHHVSRRCPGGRV